MTAQTTTRIAASESRLVVALVAMAFGAAFLFISGLLPIQAVHDAAHDTRHAIGFPCH